MTDPNEPDGIDTSGSTVPPYQGRRDSAGGDDPGGAYRDGARVGGATGPVTGDAGPVEDPAATPGGATGSPADEQPAEDVTATDRDDDRVGPAHQPGTPRAEDRA
jgi:hypothetical protein